MEIKNLLFENKGLRKTIAKNTFWLFSAEIIARLLSLVLVIYIARILGVLEYGRFSFALSFALFMSILADLGVTDISTREFSRDEKNEKKFAGIFTLEAVLCFVTLIITIVGSFFITHDYSVRKMIWILILFVLSSSLLGILFSFLRARQKMEYEAIVKISQALINIFLVFFVLFYFPTAVNVSYGYLFSTLLSLLIFALFFGFYFQPIKLEFKKGIFEILKISWPLSLGFMPGWLYMSVNSIMLGYFDLINENGWYSAASRIAIATMIIANLVMRSFYPALSKLFFQTGEKIKDTWNYLAESMVFLVVPIAVGGVALAPKIIDSFYGSDFNPSVFALQLLMLVAVISFINYPYTIMLIIANHQKENFVLIVAGAVINIFLNFVFIPRYGFYSVILATIIASFLVFFATVLLSQKNKIFIPFNNRFFKTVFVSLLSGLIMYTIINYRLVYNFNIFLTCLVGGLIYLSVFFLFNKIVFGRKLIIF